MSDNQSINDSLDIIRKALEDEDYPGPKHQDNNILILDKLVKEDGTTHIINSKSISKDEVLRSFEKKLDEVFDAFLMKWLDKNLPKYIEKSLNKKKL
jgi:cell pole-organizing protein PopZ